MTPVEIQAMFDRPLTAEEEHYDQVRAEIDALGNIDPRPLLVMQRMEIERLRADIGPLLQDVSALEAENETLRALADDRLAQMQADRAAFLRLRAAAQQARAALESADLSTGYCCCGSRTDAHGITDGHGPVDEGAYYQGKIIETLRAALKETP